MNISSQSLDHFCTSTHQSHITARRPRRDNKYRRVRPNEVWRNLEIGWLFNFAANRSTCGDAPKPPHLKRARSGHSRSTAPPKWYAPPPGKPGKPSEIQCPASGIRWRNLRKCEVDSEVQIDPQTDKVNSSAT